MSSKIKNKQKKELLMKLNKEVTDLERQIKNLKYQSIKRISIKSLKIFQHVTIAALPIVLTAGLVIGGGKLLGCGLPFVLDDITQKENIVKEIDSQNSYRVEKHYKNLEQSNQLLYSSSWTLTEEGVYQRQVDKYEFKKYTEEDILAVLDSTDFSSIEEIIGTPYSYVEERKTLTKEELKDNKPYIQAILYSISDENFIVYKESVGSNVACIVVELLLMLLIGILPTLMVWSDDGYDPIWKIKKTIRENKPEIDAKVLRKKLEIRRENLNRLTQ